MPVYTYRGVNKTGDDRQRESARAANKAEAQSHAAPRADQRQQAVREGQRIQHPHVRRQASTSKELAIFTRQFSVMIDAGLPLVQCLEILAGQQENKTFQKVLNGDARFGGRRRDAVGGHAQYDQGVRPAVRTTWWKRARPAVFSTPFCSGLSSYIEKNVKLKRAVQSASIYPIGGHDHRRRA